LGASGRVLRRAAGDELCVVVLDQVVVQPEVFFLGEDGVVGFEPVFCEEFFVTGVLVVSIVLV